MDNLSLVSGLDYSNVDFQEMDTLSNNSTYSGFTYTVEGAGKEGNWTVMGLFGQVIYSPIEKLDLILGARYDDFEDKADSEIAPRAGIVFRPMTPLTCKLLYGRAILSPQWTHLTASSVSGSYVGNPNLGPQTVNSKDLIFDLTFDRSVTNLSLFQTKTEDVINSVIVNASTGLRQYQNTGIGDYEGFELSEKIKVLDWMSLNGSVANVAEAGDTTATYLLGADLRYVPKYVYRLGFTMKPIKHLWVDLGGRMYSEVTTDDSVLGNRDIDSWTTIDMSVGYAISDFDIALYLTNLSDEEYEIGGTVSRPLPRAGFGWSLKAGYKF
jgi:outer membrane receptor protein involved in Fe transport